MNTSPPTANATVCPECGTEIAAAFRACPGCGRLVHADRLKALADAATSDANAGNLTASLASWREALELLPPGSRQFAIVREKVAALSTQIDQSSSTAASPEKKSGERSSRKTFGTVLTAILLFVFTKGKLLLAGLLKGGTFFSMLASMSIYWVAFGWKFALGLILSIYIHEMGHVAMLRRFGIRAAAPMFIPGIGAIVRLKQHLATPAEDARVGLAGPMWGLGAAVGAYLVSILAGWPSWSAIAHAGAWINLFNLMPIWQLDGGRAFNAMTKGQRGLALIVVLIAWVWVQDGLLILVAIMAIGRTFSKDAPTEPDKRALVEYVILIAALSTILSLLGPART